MSKPFGILFWGTCVLFALAVGGQLYGQVFGKERFGKWARLALFAGFAALTVLVAWRWIATGHVPTIGNFENALFGAWFIVAMVAFLELQGRYPLLAAGALPFALIILGGGALSDTAARPMVASLKSFWLYIHIFFAWLAYGAYTVACGAGVVYLSKSKKGKTPQAEEMLRLDELMFRSTVFGFITDAVMIAAGAIWAKDLWGSYWSWDPVETWSLLSWIIYGLALHLRVTLGWKGRRIAWVLVFNIITVLVTFWGINLVMSGSSHIFNVD